MVYICTIISEIFMRLLYARAWACVLLIFSVTFIGLREIIYKQQSYLYESKMM